MKQHYNNRILVFGDLHSPYHHKDSLTFLKEQRDEFKPDRVVCIGDVVDFYAASRYPKDPDHPDSMVNEIRKTRKMMKKLGKIFPKAELCMGNHDDRLSLRAKIAGIPSEAMMTFGDIIGAPAGWRLHRSYDNLTLNVRETKENITFAHHRGANTLLIAQRLGRTFVAGHQHTKGQIVGYNNGEKTLFGVNVPCLISDEGSPFSYTQVSHINPVQGCILIEDGVPQVKML